MKVDRWHEIPILIISLASIFEIAKASLNILIMLLKRFVTSTQRRPASNSPNDVFPVSFGIKFSKSFVILNQSGLKSGASNYFEIFINDISSCRSCSQIEGNKIFLFITQRHFLSPLALKSDTTLKSKQRLFNGTRISLILSDAYRSGRLLLGDLMRLPRVGQSLNICSLTADKTEANKPGIASMSNYKSVKKANSQIKFTLAGRKREVNFLVSFSVIEEETEWKTRV